MTNGRYLTETEELRADICSKITQKKISQSKAATEFGISLRGCPKISWIVIEAKNGSDLEDFFAADVPVYLCKKKSSRDELIFPSRTVQVIFGRPLSATEPDMSNGSLETALSDPN